jgi:hypothetical protein
MMDPERLVYALHAAGRAPSPGVPEAYEAIDAGERCLAVLRSHPDCAAPETVRADLRRQLAALE